MTDYSDLLSRPHHVSSKHPPMPVEARAAQFASFAALSGYGAAVNEAGRRTDRRRELSDWEKEQLDRKLALLLAALPKTPTVTVTYFVPDEKKAGGRYATRTGAVRRVDTVARCLIFADGNVLSLDAVTALDGPLFVPPGPDEA